MSHAPADALMEGPPPPRARWCLRIYVAGQSPKSLAAMMNLKRLCDAHLAGAYEIEVVDLLDHPHRAAADQVVAIPTLVRRLPTPTRKIIGDLSDRERVAVILDLPAVESGGR
jgi:circadian clock protein KaiB